MNSTEKLEMQEAEDGSAVVQLPEGEESPQNESSKNDYREDDDDEPQQADSDPEREAIREARREERRLKKQIHREKARESNTLISALKKQNEHLAERLAVIEKKTSGAELARVDKAIEDAGVQLEYAKMKLQESVSASDGQGAIQAQEMLYDAKQKMEALSNIKRQATHYNSQPKQNISVPDPIVQKYVTDWMEENPWYDPTGKNEESQITQVIDKKLTEEGYDPSSPDYWDELTYRVKKRLPEMSNRAYNDSSVRNQRPRSVVTSSGRESSASPKGNQYVLTPERVSAMKEAGVWDSPDARKRATQRYMEWDRQNKDRK
mgnify:CR=1 FL=1|jgi:hypothetical protein